MSTTELAPLPDSDIALAATKFAESQIPAVVHDHCIRGYLYGRELAGRRGLRPGRDYDDELLFLCNVLHDLGLSPAVEESDERFEVHGADLAVAFARSQGLAEDKLPVLWDAVALHTSVGIADRKQPEVALAHLGISADVVGADRDQLPAGLVDAVHERYPRRDLGHVLTDLIVEGARRRPAKGNPLTFPGHLLGLHVPLGTAATWFDVLAAAGWDDRPVRDVTAEGAASPEELATEFSARLARRDVDGLLALYDANAVFVPAPGQITTGREQVRGALAAMVDAGASVDLELRACHVVADLALIAKRATVRTPGSEPAQTVITTEVARRRADGRWFYVVDHPFFGSPSPRAAG